MDWQEVIKGLASDPRPERCAEVQRGIQHSYEFYPENTLMMLKDYGLTKIEELPSFIEKICHPALTVPRLSFDPGLVNPRHKSLSSKQWNLVREYFDLFQEVPSWPTHPLVLLDSVTYLPSRVIIDPELSLIPSNWWSSIMAPSEWTDIAVILNPANANYRPINREFLQAYYQDIIQNWDIVIYGLDPIFHRWTPDWKDRSLTNFRHWAIITKLLSRIIVLKPEYQELLAEHLFQFSFDTDAQGIEKALAMLYLYWLNRDQVPRVTKFLSSFM